MIAVILDTNALMLPVERDVRLFEELDRILPERYISVVPRPVAVELHRLSDGAGVEATAASVGSDLLTRCSIVNTEADFADDAIVELAAIDDILAQSNEWDVTATVDSTVKQQHDDKDIGTHTNVHNNIDADRQIDVEADAQVDNSNTGVIDLSESESAAKATTKAAESGYTTTKQYVVTEDRPLRDRLHKRNIRVIGIRGRNTLEITEP
ncbi:PilTVapc superfamily protein [Haloquadratum walsbyi]|jgi:SSU processome protein Utp24|uniref:PilTVapc superfamily protein n=1 Tax=Haloquadratum walsbyi J07HQW2 TaxID=1238425 RepID=U1PRC1_9EURY|nr:MAG: PilTVapc superfamily protein [Haloquadratum walsbyi J07HQW2]